MDVYHAALARWRITDRASLATARRTPAYAAANAEGEHRHLLLCASRAFCQEHAAALEAAHGKGKWIALSGVTVVAVGEREAEVFEEGLAERTELYPAVFTQQLGAPLASLSGMSGGSGSGNGSGSGSGGTCTRPPP